MQKVLLKNVADIAISNVDKKSKDSEIPVTLCNFTDVYYNWSITKTQCSKFMRATATVNEIEKFKIINGDVAITKDSETRDDIGVSTFFDDVADDVLLGYHCALIRPNKSYLDGAYLNALLNTSYAKRYFAYNASGSGQRFSLSIDSISNFPFELPSLSVQLRITNILGTIDKKININKQMIRLLDNYLSTVFDYKYIAYKGEDLIWNENIKKHIPKDWQVYYLDELFSFVKGKIPAQLKDRNEDVYDNIYLTIDTINGGQELYCSSVNMPYSKGNVLMVMDGAASGDVYVGFDGVVGSTFCMLKTKQSFVSNNFLYQILRSYSTNYKKTNVGSTVPHANKDYIQSMQIALPKEIDMEFDLVRNQIIRLTKQIKTLKKIRDFLLPLLVNGQVKVQ